MSWSCRPACSSGRRMQMKVRFRCSYVRMRLTCMGGHHRYANRYRNSLGALHLRILPHGKWNLPLEMCASGRTPYDGPSLRPVCREHVRHRTSAHHDPCVYGDVGEVEDDARPAEADAEEVGYARRLKSEAGRVCNGSSNHQAQC